ncbi:hypothetical protein ACIBI4_31045 [Streptomyces sp. NPDC050418]|uniref:hypothetical protein n=1 Tax=Streptomyces sp. NPDC050418 TaxID=3365612 RepID=UPI0037B347DF
MRHTDANVSLFLGTSRQDPDSPPSYIEEFSKAAKGTGVRVKTVIKPTGGHNWDTWRSMYPEAIPWLSEQLDQPQ